MNLFRTAEDESSGGHDVAATQETACPCGRGFGPPHYGDYDLSATFDNGAHPTVGCGRSGGQVVVRNTLIRR